MSAFSVIHRELKVAARRPATYQGRLLAGGGAFALTLGFAWFSRNPSPQAGAVMFGLLFWGAFLICTLEGVRISADSLARERRDGTLGLLFLTKLRGGQIVLGKLAAVAVRSSSSVLAILPVLAIPLALGGVTWGESWRGMVVLLHTLFLAASAGLLVSAVCMSPQAALTASLILIGMILLVPLLLGFCFPGAAGMHWLAGPLGMAIELRALRFNTNPSGFWQAAFCSSALSGIMLGVAGILLGNFARLETFMSALWRCASTKANVARRNPWKKAFDGQNPAAWLAERTLPGTRLLQLAVGTGIILSFFIGLGGGGNSELRIFLLLVFFGVLLKLWVAMVAPQSIHAARQSGALELLLCTPMAPEEFVRGQLERFTTCFTSCFLVSLGFPMALGLANLLSQNENAPFSSHRLFAAGMVWWLIMWHNVYALFYLGLWFGLSSRNLEGAIAKTVAAGILLPWTVFVVAWAGSFGLILVSGSVGFLFLWPLCCMFWASHRLESSFRDTVAEQFISLDSEPNRRKACASSQPIGPALARNRN